METTLKTAPTKEPVSLDEVKQHLRIELELTDHDDYLTTLIKDAREYAEELTWRKFITQTWYAYYDDWPCYNYFELPFGSLQSVTAIKYTDTDAAELTWSSAEYIVGIDYQKGRVTLDDGYTWPNVVLYPSNPIEVEFKCGYGAAATDVPANIKKAMKIMIADSFENREDIVIGMSVHDLKVTRQLLDFYSLATL